MAEMISDAILDVRGEACPFPLIRTKKQMDQMASGEILKVIANDPVAPQNIDAWTKKSGDKILGVENEGHTFIIYVKKK